MIIVETFDVMVPYIGLFNFVFVNIKGWTITSQRGGMGNIETIRKTIVGPEKRREMLCIKQKQKNKKMLFQD